MSAATTPTVAPTIPTPQRVTLIRVVLPGRGNYHTEPSWYIVGDYHDYAFKQQWYAGREITLGDQGDGSWLLDATDLGLDPAICWAYAAAEEERGYLENQEDMYDLHSDPDGKCLCGEIAEQKAILDAHEPAITAAVNERFDTWTRRRHLVALGVATGQSCCNPGMYDGWMSAPTEEAAAEPAPAAAGAASAPLEPYPTWSDWPTYAFAPVAAPDAAPTSP